MFGGLAASGWHTMALTMRLLVDGGAPIAGGIIGAGAEELRWPKPVRPGDMLRMPVKALRRRGPVWRFEGHAYVGDTLCAEAEFSAMIHDGADVSDDPSNSAD